MIEFRNLTRTRIPTAPFERLYARIFPKKNFEMSVVFAGSQRMRTLNRRHRSKDKIANVLSFSLSKSSGEVFLHIHEDNLEHLFVHGCLHLLGYDHVKDSDAYTMETKERDILKR